MSNAPTNPDFADHLVRETGTATPQSGGPFGPPNEPPLMPLPADRGVFIGMNRHDMMNPHVVPGTTFTPCHNCGGDVSQTPQSLMAAATQRIPPVPVCSRCFPRYLAANAMARTPEESPIGVRPIKFQPFTAGQTEEYDRFASRKTTDAAGLTESSIE